jgi:putative tricarboxylic transport membrane protein
MELIAYFKALIDFLTFYNIILMAFSMTIGIIVGALPGLSAVLGIALLTGITYSFDTATAMIMMIGVYIGAIYGGSFASILINIPGTGSAVATCFDGYPLAKQGKATDAIIAARLASFIGSFVGFICYVIFTPLIIRIALSFTSAEYFWLAIFGVFIIGALSSPDLPIKGWISGLIGLMLSFVGLEDIGAYNRFSFGIPQLTSGIPWVPLMVGFFGVPQIAKFIRDTKEFEMMKQLKKTMNFLRVIKQHLIGIIKWASLGVAIGAIPAVGENIAALVAYGVAKKDSRRPEKFGTGVIEGVMAPEVANNSAVGGAIIPMLTLGVPGSPPTAVLMGALIMRGIRPGPMLAIENPAFIYNMGAWIFWGTIMLLVIGILISRPISQVLKIPPKILAPLIAVICVVGTFSVSSEIFDIKLLIIFGTIGYIMDKYGFSAGPLVLGFVLGPLTDANFRRTLDLAHGNPLALINRPISFLIFLAVSLMLLNYFPSFKRVKDCILSKVKRIRKE